MLIEPLLIFLIFFSPLIYGSVTILPLSIIESLSFLMLFILLFRGLLKEKLSFPNLNYLPLVIFIVLVIFQLIPFSQESLSFISSSTAGLYRAVKVEPNGTGAISVYPEATINMFLQVLAYIALFLSVLIYADTEKKAKRIAIAIMVSGILYSVYGILAKPYMPANSYQFATFINRNHFAAYVEMIIPVAIAYSFIARSRTSRGFMIFAASIMIAALFLSSSRAGRVCFILGMVLFIALLKIKQPGKKAIITMAALLILSSIFIIGIGLETTLKRMDTLLDPAKAFYIRYDIYKDTLNMIRDFPLFGTGLGTFRDIAEMYKTVRLQSMYFFAHNEPLQLLSETGMTGFLLILLFLVLYSKDVFLIWIKRHSPLAVYVTLGAMTGLLSLCLHSFFEFPLHIPADAMLFFITLGLSYRFVTLEDPDAKYGRMAQLKLPKQARMLSLVVLSVIFLSVETIVSRRYLAQISFEKAEENNISPYNALKGIDRAITLNPGNSLYLNKKGDLLLRVNDAAAAEESYKKAIDLNPTRADYHLDLGHLYIVTGREDLALEEFKKAALLNPQGIRKNTSD